ncbi:MAG TPA: UDP-glucose/GDP-mannose dehydrogenase family protein [Xanthobacteraceae bacterium]|nr:UDP-glucose/GDP-mannose dehydrogenase family protein [Xanthobacteraceae bacterium]
MHIMMIGAGYVGLVSGACLADFGHTVRCIDKAPGRIDALRRGEIPIYEPGLADLVSSNLEAGRLTFDTDIPRGLNGAQAVFIAVGTPSRRGDGFADLSFVRAAAREVAAALTDFAVIAVKSTVPVGTADEIERIIREMRPDADFSVASNPEFLREGAAIADFKRPDRIVIGAEDKRTAAIMREVYRPLFLNQAPVLVTGRRSAELTKYAANAFLATKIAFINEIADLCERVGADVQDVARGMGLDNRIGPKFLHSGPGYGGSCFPKDTQALITFARDCGSPMRIVETVTTVNEQRKRAMGRKVIRACGGSVRGKTIAVFGLTFKPNTDDVRDAPALAIITALQDCGGRIRAYDPKGVEQARQHLEDVDFADDPYACAAGADALVIVTEWDAFRALDLARVRKSMRTAVLVDLRNIYRPAEMRRAGFVYESVGRPIPSPIRTENSPFPGDGRSLAPFVAVETVSLRALPEEAAAG